MSRAYRCDKCHKFIEKVWIPEEHVLEKRDEGDVIAKFEVFKPQNYDICRKCGIEMIIVGLYREAQKEGGEIKITWKGGELTRELTREQKEALGQTEAKLDKVEKKLKETRKQ